MVQQFEETRMASAIIALIDDNHAEWVASASDARATSEIREGGARTLIPKIGPIGQKHFR